MDDSIDIVSLNVDNNNTSNFQFLFVSVNVGKKCIIDDQFHEVERKYITRSHVLVGVLEEWLGLSSRPSNVSSDMMDYVQTIMNETDLDTLSYIVSSDKIKVKNCVGKAKLRSLKLALPHL